MTEERALLPILDRGSQRFSRRDAAQEIRQVPGVDIEARPRDADRLCPIGRRLQRLPLSIEQPIPEALDHLRPRLAVERGAETAPLDAASIAAESLPDDGLLPREVDGDHMGVGRLLVVLPEVAPTGGR